MFSAEELDEGYRLGKYGLLDREIGLPAPAKSSWVPIVPDGMAMANQTWKRWLFLQFHVGIVVHDETGCSEVVGIMLNMYTVPENAAKAKSGAHGSYEPRLLGRGHD